MKATAKKINQTKKSIAFVIAIFVTFIAHAQTANSYCNYTLVKGNENKAGSMYRINSVKSGVDALITLNKISSSAVLKTFKTSGYGYTSSFDPELNIAAGCWGYATFSIQFVKAGTIEPITYADILFEGKKNIKIKSSDISRFGNDAKISIIKTSQSSFRVMIYAANLSNYAAKKSGNIEFKKFACVNTQVTAPVVNLDGNVKDNMVQVKWQIAYPDVVSSIILEKSYDAREFSSVNEYWINANGNEQTKFSYLDLSMRPIVYYRLKMISANGTVEYSNVAGFTKENENDRNASVSQAKFAFATNISNENNLITESNEQK